MLSLNLKQLRNFEQMSRGYLRKIIGGLLATELSPVLALVFLKASRKPLLFLGALLRSQKLLQPSRNVVAKKAL